MASTPGDDPRPIGSFPTPPSAPTAPDAAAGDSLSPIGLPRPIGFVLGGGGSLGAAQVGMLQALAERRILPDVIAGTSVGSINGAVVALDPVGAANRLSHTWAKMTRDAVFPGGLFAQARTLQASRTHLFPNDGLGRLIDEFLGPDADFDELAIPFAAVALDVETAAARVITNGPLRPALQASSAIPGIYPVVRHDGHQFYDGGLVANVPLRQALALGARSLVVLDCNFPGQLPPPPDSLADTLMYSALVAMRSQAALETPEVAKTVPVVYLPGPPLRMISPLDFSHTAELIEGAYAASRPFLAGLTVDGPGLYGSLSGRPIG